MMKAKKNQKVCLKNRFFKGYKYKLVGVYKILPNV